MRKEMEIKEPSAASLGSPAPLITLIPCALCVFLDSSLIITGLENRLEVIRMFRELADILIAMFVSSCSPKRCLESLGGRVRSIECFPSMGSRMGLPVQTRPWRTACRAAHAFQEQAELPHLFTSTPRKTQI